RCHWRGFGGMRIQSNPHLPTDIPGLVRQLSSLHVLLTQQLNGLSEGRIAASTFATTAAPTAGAWQQGDFIRNSEPEEAGSDTAKYVITGWLCVASGEPGTWVETRCLTGN